MSEVSILESCIDSVIVKTVYDGFQIKISIIIDSDDVETACYLYDGKEVISKSGYKNSNHVFPVENNNNMKCRVFFRSKKDNSIKKTKFYPVESNNIFRYKLSENIIDDINYNNCEITNTKTNAIEIYEKNGFKPRNDNIPYLLKLPIDWLDDPFSDRNWMFQLHAWRMLDAYFKRSDNKDLDYIAQVINDWVIFEKENESKWLWYDMSTGLRALKITFYLKKCYEKKVDHKIDDLDYLINEHLKHLSNPKELSHGNHGLFQLHGLKSLTYLLESVDDLSYDISDIKNYANMKMSELIISQLGKNGVHTEHSPDYHFFAHNKIVNIIKSPWWLDFSKDILDILDLSENAKPWLVFPNNKCIPIGDSTSNSAKKNLTALEAWPNLKSGNYIGARLDGYAVIRSLKSVPIEKSSYLFFQGSFNSLAHKHADDLSFILQENGKDILIDSGKYGYQKDDIREYFVSTRAHNTIEVDKKNIFHSRKNTYGSALIGQPICIDGFWIVIGKADHVLNGYTHERTIIYKPGIDIYVIDKIINMNPNLLRKVEQWWHFDVNDNVAIKGDKVVVSQNNESVIEICSSSSVNDLNYKYYKGHNVKGFLSGWASKSYLNYEPSPAIAVSTFLNKKTLILTRIKLSKSASDTPIVYQLNGEIKTTKLDLLRFICK